MNNFYKKNNNIANYFISKEFIPLETDKASFINLLKYNCHIGFWLSNKFIYSSEKHYEQVAIGLIYDNPYPIVKYDEKFKTTHLKIFNCSKNNWFI